MGFTSTEIHLKRRPNGMPVAEDFLFVENPLADPAEGQVLVRNLYLSVDPYMRGRMNEGKGYAEGYKLNEVMYGGAIGRVEASRNPAFAEGDLVSSNNGWRQGFVSSGRDMGKLPETSLPASVHLGPLGGTGRTAYEGLLGAAHMADAETVFVSGAAGAVGSIAGQIAKLRGCRVLGSAGSAEKVAFCQEIGFDYAFNYHEGHLLTHLREGAPDGLDVYFDNVGGDHLEAALSHMKRLGRIALCGAISQYNATTPVPGPRNLAVSIGMGLNLRGFIVGMFPELRESFMRDMTGWLEAGQIIWKETVHEGIRSTPDAFIGLFTGGNLGKMVVKLGD
ncbi:MAG: NADP-dependent oxidoreductase [Proteobacteria bacterium]|jgi:NADPH-dependent curcumin reductase CurA|nr:NADP-dependent oxidoreductase [Pseudomonadota bacterium]MDA1301815.1 NADP-dependent oxidoreductase [Pseudomonadota bacterium]